LLTGTLLNKTDHVADSHCDVVASFFVSCWYLTPKPDNILDVLLIGARPWLVPLITTAMNVLLIGARPWVVPLNTTAML
jgi:hypothetical protein